MVVFYGNVFYPDEVWDALNNHPDIQRKTLLEDIRRDAEWQEFCENWTGEVTKSPEDAGGPTTRVVGGSEGSGGASGSAKPEPPSIGWTDMIDITEFGTEGEPEVARVQMGRWQGRSYPTTLRTSDGTAATPRLVRHFLDKLFKMDDWHRFDIPWSDVHSGEAPTMLRGHITGAGFDIDLPMGQDDPRHMYQMSFDDGDGKLRPVSFELYVNWADMQGGSTIDEPDSLIATVDVETSTITRVDTEGHNLAIPLN